MPELIEVPEELAYEIGHDQGHNAWPWYADRAADHWAVTPYHYNGEQVLMPFAGDLLPATRSSVEATYGPLSEVPHCTSCGGYLFYRNGVCRSSVCPRA